VKKKTSVIIGTHNHLPLGTPPAEAERRYQEALKPLLAILYRYPGFPVTLHYSGILMEWLEEFHPEFLTLLGEMVRRGQVEVLGGGYYDPILPMIPMSDKLGQLEKMTTWLRVHFETRPRGCWIAEQVWEPSLASVLRASGIDYTFVDDVQLRIGGAPEGELCHPFIAEDQGKIISLLPVSSDLVDRAARGDGEGMIAFLKEMPDGDPRDEGPLGACMVDGVSAAASLLGGSWLEEFVRRVQENGSWLEATTPVQLLKDSPPWRRVFIPSCTSREMMAWALPEDLRCQYREARRREAGNGGGRFLVGGQFRQFLDRYPESWLMYAKMMNTHVLVSQVRGDKYKKKAAQNELWKGQSHHAYWHGDARGIYENGQRKAVYKSLIEAEKITRATEIFAPSIISVDYDMDNLQEYLYQGSELNAYIHCLGGALFELDFLPASWNYLDTMVNREGPATGGGPGAYQRKAFIDHFFPRDCRLDQFAAGACAEAGDFAAGRYELAELNRALPELLMRRAGTVQAGEGGGHAVGIEKRFVFRPRSLDVYYRVTNLGETPLSTCFGMEINISLAARSAENGRLFILEEDRTREIQTDASQVDGVQGLLVRDVRNEVSITLTSALAYRCWSVPVETALAEEPSRPIFQSHCFVPQWDLALAPRESWENHMSVGFEKSQGTEGAR
jgi:4-alpha-glucanotransferase